MFISTYDLLSKYIPLILPQYAYKAAQIEHKNYPVSVIVLKCLLFSQAVVSNKEQTMRVFVVYQTKRYPHPKLHAIVLKNKSLHKNDLLR